jgi:hypothetical protein
MVQDGNVVVAHEDMEAKRETTGMQGKKRRGCTACLQPRKKVNDRKEERACTWFERCERPNCWMARSADQGSSSVRWHRRRWLGTLRAAAACYILCLTKTFSKSLTGHSCNSMHSDSVLLHVL